MDTKSSLLECQKAFLAALYDAAAPGPLASIAGNGLAPEARLRIYRRSCNEIQTAALRTSYPAVMALVGQDWFDQAARRYRRQYPSHAGNLQAFGAHFADYLATIPPGRTLAYLADVARLEWLRQEAVLAADEQALEFDDFVTCLGDAGEALRVRLRTCVRWLVSRHQVLTIWRFALSPDGNLALGDEGENVLLWREGGEVAMASVDSATLAFLDALAAGTPLDEASAAATTLDAEFDAPGCISGLIQRHLIARVLPHSVKGASSP
ncbi:DNA-binding domain-containing protein [Castellaniella sp.]|uniref:HvfC/BufC N-terminal domain-containing protein n=1 Tax=Castellaniella sp. TaxID=1955812 RepID=UPI0025C1CFA1|nr:DNA-binding domain-containing protein [Castellaniella sp.]